MTETTSINIRIDKDLKQQAELLFETLGINMTTAMNIFLRQAVREQALPFRVTAKVDYVPAYKGDYDQYDSYGEYIKANLKQTELRISEGKMKYYTVDQIKSGLEEVLDENI